MLGPRQGISSWLGKDLLTFNKKYCYGYACENFPGDHYSSIISFKQICCEVLMFGPLSPLIWALAIKVAKQTKNDVFFVFAI